MTSLKFSFEFGEDPNLTAKDNSYPLRFACQWGHEKQVRLLLEYSADPNTTFDGRSPLNWPLDHFDKDNSETMTRLILQYRAGPNLMQRNG